MSAKKVTISRLGAYKSYTKPISEINDVIFGKNLKTQVADSVIQVDFSIHSNKEITQGQ